MSKLMVTGLVSFLSISYGVTVFSGAPETIEISDDEQQLLSDNEQLKWDEEQLLLHAGAEEITNARLVRVPYAPNLCFYWPLGLPIQNHEHVEPIGFHEGEAENLREAILKRFNEYRHHHGIELFEINEKLNNSAQEWANTMERTQKVEPMPADHSYYGETMIGPLRYDEDAAVKVVDLWYSAIGFLRVGMKEDQFLEENIKPNEYLYNLTQLLWKPTREIGVGVARDENSNYIYACVHYYPPGNLTKHYLEYLPEIKEEDIENGRELKEKYSAKIPFTYG